MIDTSLLKSGDKVLVHAKGFNPVSWGIRHLTESYWNHAGQIIVGESETWVIEALFVKGVVMTSFAKYLNSKKYDIKIVRLRQDAFKDKAEYDAGIRTSTVRLQNKVGDKYDWQAIVFLAVKFTFKGLLKKWTKKNHFQARHKFFCSELLCTASYQISSIFPRLYKGKTDSTCGTTTPRDISKCPHEDYILGTDKN